MSRLLIFDLLRILAISLVAIAHIAQKYDTPILNSSYGIPYFYYVSLGGIGVTILLMVSGAVLRLNHPIITDYKKFVVRRACRIYPAYWFSLILILIGSAVKSHIPYLTLRDLALSITGMYAFVGEWGGPINAVSWFIGLIVILYLMYPLILPLIEKHSYLALFALLATSVLSRWSFGHEPGRMTDWFPLCRIFEFALGIFMVERGLYPKTLNNLKVIYILSSISFYVFLIHVPLLFAVRNNIFLYISSVLILSYFIYIFDDKIIQPRLKSFL